MFCPQCGSGQSDEVKFCKACGVNLQVVQQAVNTREGGETFDWNKTWVTEMFLSAGEMAKRKEELERQRGVTPEIKRYNEIKGGIITSSVGLGVMVFLYVLMQGIILSGEVGPGEAEILSRIWVAGIIPFFIGLAITLNGLWLGKKIVEVSGRKSKTGPLGVGRPADHPALRAADTGEFIPTNFSVTEDATKHLKRSESK